MKSNVTEGSWTERRRRRQENRTKRGLTEQNAEDPKQSGFHQWFREAFAVITRQKAMQAAERKKYSTVFLISGFQFLF